MSGDVDTIVMELSSEEKVQLIDRLHNSLMNSEREEIQKKWIQESERRYNHYKASKISTVDYNDIKRIY